ncbi:aminotransferase [Mycena pura]|uniref:Aminotransferase n=1 Tax=Mycena pura TaxID=153505 RepID=A0AAD6UW36_9AGAR|nr:aminotransferase [Mycena pura]
MYDLLTTTRWDPFLARLGWNNHSHFLLLQFHLDRLKDASSAHGWPQAQSALSNDALLEKCQAAVRVASQAGDESFKVRGSIVFPPAHVSQLRITLSRDGVLTATASPVPALSMDPLSASFSRPLTDSATLYGPAMTLFVDTQPTPPSGLFTSTKTTERSVYDAARARVGLPATSFDADVILYNPDEHITEASVSNVAFYHSNNWVTPPLSTGCLPGVLRRWLLQHKRIREAEVGELTKSDLHPGDWALVFNSVRGCRLGRITAS